jgi:hypothetical protein
LGGRGRKHFIILFFGMNYGIGIGIGIRFYCIFDRFLRPIK